MQISCPNCRKKFLVKNELIPIQGRQLQCGKCGHKWFFTIKDSQATEVKNEKVQETYNKIKVSENKNYDLFDDTKTKKEDLIKKIEIKKNNHNKKKINFFKIILVIIISLTAIILVIETFKNQISLFYPNIIIILDNLFQTLKDIYLFFKDLIR